MNRATEARKAAGLTIAEAARLARVSPAYLRRVEREGASFVLAQRLARLYGVGIDAFIQFRKAGNLPKTACGGQCGRPSRATQLDQTMELDHDQ